MCIQFREFEVPDINTAVWCIMPKSARCAPTAWKMSEKYEKHLEKLSTKHVGVLRSLQGSSVKQREESTEG